MPKSSSKTKSAPQNSKPNPFKTVKGSWICFVVYPDNIHQMDAFNYLKDINSTMCWIEHEPEDDEKKKHIHVMIHFDKARTASGFCSAFGKAWFSTSDNGELTAIPLGQESIFISEGKAVEHDIFSIAYVVSSPCDYYRYMIHSDFKSIRSGKKRYNQSDIQMWGDIQLLQKLAFQEYQNYENTITDLMSYSDGCTSANELLHKVLADGRFDLVSYIQSKAYFVKEFMLNFEKKGG